MHAPSVLQETTYATTYDYDANGNLQHLTRNDQHGNPMDNLTYHYETDANGNYKNNRLLHVNDAAQSNQTTDLKDQGNYVQNLTPTHNYSYDKIGNLVADKSEEIEEISWTMQGKVKRITRLPNSQKPDLVFNYDGLGNRVSKTVIPKSSVNNEDSITTYYVRDAQGNILATYEKTKYKNGDEKFYLKEQYLYGSSRIGMNISNLLLASNVNGNVEIKEYDGYFTKEIGNKRYELTNHLGNVLAVVSDKKGADNEPDVVSVSDYYPFGMGMPGRIYTNPSNSYRFGFGGHEKVDEVAGTGNTVDMGDRWLSVKLGRTFKLDRKAINYPSLSSYSYAANSPLIIIDPDGKEIHLVFESDAARKAYQNRINFSLGGAYEVSFNEISDNVYGGAFQVVLNPTTSKNILTESQQTFYQEYDDIVKDAGIVRQNIVMDDPQTHVGDFKTAKMDMVDIDQFDLAGEGGASSAGALIHETKEQLEKSKLGLLPKEGTMRDYLRPHASGVQSENKVNGNMRFDDNDNNRSIFNEKDGTRTIQQTHVDKSGKYTVTKTKEIK